MKLVPDELFDGIYQYLSSRPWREVAQAMAALSQCKSVEEKTTEDQPKVGK